MVTKEQWLELHEWMRCLVHEWMRCLAQHGGGSLVILGGYGCP
jgi:hypothetical protein